MDQTENILAPLPGCWLEFGLKGDAKTGDVNLNTMPAILFAMENYGTAAVVYTDAPEGSMGHLRGRLHTPQPRLALPKWGSNPRRRDALPPDLFCSRGTPPTLALCSTSMR